MSLFQLKADLATAAPHERISLMQMEQAELGVRLHELDMAPTTDAAATAVARKRLMAEVVAVDALIAAEAAPVVKAPWSPKPAPKGGTT